MKDVIQFRNIASVLEEVDYPIERIAAAEEFSDVKVVFADGEAYLGELLAKTDTSTFGSAADIETALHNVLPRGAVGEPYQSEGDS